MADTHLLLLVFYILTVLSYTIIAFVNAKGNPRQIRKTVMTFCFMIFPVFIFMFSLMKLYVYFFEPKANKK